MDPHTGHIYGPSEIQRLPKEIQDRLVPVPAPYNDDGSDTVVKPKTIRRRNKNKSQGAFDAMVSKRRAKNKMARKSRKKNR